jgi:hypothetical protein
MANVPNLPGVPALASYAVNTVVLLASDAISQFFGTAAPVWGVFLDGEPVLPEVQSVLTLGYKRDWMVADYQVQDGAFESYDKVQLPFDVRIRVTSGASGAERQDFLDAVDQVGDSLDLYDIVTPEKIYSSVNVTHVDYDRSAASGVGMISADIWFVEIRVEAAATFSNTQQPGEAAPQGAGNVQPQATQSRVDQAFDSGQWQVQ